MAEAFRVEDGRHGHSGGETAGRRHEGGHLPGADGRAGLDGRGAGQACRCRRFDRDRASVEAGGRRAAAGGAARAPPVRAAGRSRRREADRGHDVVHGQARTGSELVAGTPGEQGAGLRTDLLRPHGRSSRRGHHRLPDPTRPARRSGAHPDRAGQVLVRRHPQVRSHHAQPPPGRPRLPRLDGTQTAPGRRFRSGPLPAVRGRGLGRAGRSHPGAARDAFRARRTERIVRYCRIKFCHADNRPKIDEAGTFVPFIALRQWPRCRSGTARPPRATGPDGRLARWCVRPRHTGHWSNSGQDLTTGCSWGEHHERSWAALPPPPFPRHSEDQV